MIEIIIEIFDKPYFGVSIFLFMLLCTFVLMWDHAKKEIKIMKGIK